jgi:hypothetical protein
MASWTGSGNRSRSAVKVGKPAVLPGTIRFGCPDRSIAGRGRSGHSAVSSWFALSSPGSVDSTVAGIAGVVGSASAIGTVSSGFGNSWAVPTLPCRARLGRMKVRARTRAPRRRAKLVLPLLLRSPRTCIGDPLPGRHSDG